MSYYGSKNNANTEKRGKWKPNLWNREHQSWVPKEEYNWSAYQADGLARAKAHKAKSISCISYIPVAESDPENHRESGSELTTRKP